MTPDARPPEETRALARLPGGLDLEIRHRRAGGGSGPEHVVVSLTAPAGFEAWARMLEGANPVLAWMRVVEAAWAPWLALMGAAARSLPGKEPSGRP